MRLAAAGTSAEGTSMDLPNRTLQAYPLVGVDCARCAQRIEDALRREPGFEDATVDVATGAVLLPPDGLERARAIVARVEPGARLLDRPAAPGRERGGAATEAGSSTRLGDRPAGGGGPCFAMRDEPAQGAAAAAPAGGAGLREGAHRGAGAVGDAEADERRAMRRRLAALGLATVLFAAAALVHRRFAGTPLGLLADAVLLAVYLGVGRGVLTAALRNLRRGEVFDENFLMTAATLGAIALRELPEAVAVMLFYTVGEFFQDLAVQRSRRSIRALLDLRPEFARVRRGGVLETVDPAAVAVGEAIEVRPGERIPLDGRVTAGSSFVDTSALTGEAVPRRVEPGDEVLAGMVNVRGVLTVRVSRPFGASQVVRVLELVERAAARKAPTERFITTFARYYTPAVVAVAVALAVVPPLVVPGMGWGEAVRRALVLLVIACPCALVLSVPLGYFAGLGAASRQGVLVKGAHYLDALARLDAVVWDKTGTLTRGEYEVVAVRACDGTTPERVVELAAHAEAASGHPIAAAIARAYGRPVDPGRVAEVEELAGRGVRARVDGHRVWVGSARFLRQEGVDLADGERLGLRFPAPAGAVAVSGCPTGGGCAEGRDGGVTGVAGEASGFGGAKASGGAPSGGARAIAGAAGSRGEGGPRRVEPGTAPPPPAASEARSGKGVGRCRVGTETDGAADGPGGTEVLVAVDGRLVGRIVIADRLKPGSVEAIRALRRLGIRRQVMLTGDRPEVARAVAAALSLDEVRAGLLPDEKVAALEQLERLGRHEPRADG
ncbi:heavy metal translocating P-type ATPase [Thermaerobacter sp. FW80]|nr:heavy metal translocating P-type ATPase [Thermaerobacter sp. FW80]